MGAGNRADCGIGLEVPRFFLGRLPAREQLADQQSNRQARYTPFPPVPGPGPPEVPRIVAPYHRIFGFINKGAMKWRFAGFEWGIWLGKYIIFVNGNGALSASRAPPPVIGWALGGT